MRSSASEQVKTMFKKREPKLEKVNQWSKVSLLGRGWGSKWGDTQTWDLDLKLADKQPLEQQDPTGQMLAPKLESGLLQTD